MLADSQHTIVAPVTAQGVGAIAVIRLSGSRAIALTQSVFKGKDLTRQPSHSIHFGTICHREQVVDEVVVALFRAPRSFTREDVVEISSHGSPVVVEEIVKILLQEGARLATPGEFTKRAFLNGRLDLVQAEAVADLISAETKAGQQVALHQMRGGFSKQINVLREELIGFAALIELELDFSEEDVAFARRDELTRLISKIQSALTVLIDSFDRGAILKNGIQVVIAGKPNTGKSTLLNALLNEEKAIVSPLPGTTRDILEGELNVDGILFRFVDTAGLRQAEDTIESIGIQRAKERMQQASFIVYLLDGTASSPATANEDMPAMGAVPHLKVVNKMDELDADRLAGFQQQGWVCISAKEKLHLQELLQRILQHFRTGKVSVGDVTITNLRHYENLRQTQGALTRAATALQQGMSGEFLATDIRQALHYLGELTGQITTEDLLGDIFSKFCIGK